MAIVLKLLSKEKIRTLSYAALIFKRKVKPDSKLVFSNVLYNLNPNALVSLEMEWNFNGRNLIDLN